MSKKSTITFNIDLDEHHVPNNIVWEASDAQDKGECDATMLAMWDKNEKMTMRIDLWTKDMMVEDMQAFLYQNLMTTADAFERATNDGQTAKEMREFAQKLGERFNLVRKA